MAPIKPDSDGAEDDKEAAHLRRSSERTAIADRLESDGEAELATILRNCGSPLRLTCVCCGNGRLVEARCKKRWCPVCARVISAKRVAKYEGAVASMQWPIFVTLTLKNLKRITVADVKAVRRAFRKMRQRVWWDRSVVGGIASVEVTNIGNGWHLHVHAIVDCKWLAVTVPPPKPFEKREAMKRRFVAASTEVGEAWAAALGHKRATVKIKRAYGKRDRPELMGKSQSISVEVLKYSVKPTDLIECKEPIGDLLRMMGAARLVSSWGSCYGKNLDPDGPQKYDGGMCECGATKSYVPESVVDMQIQGVRKATWARGFRPINNQL